MGYNERRTFWFRFIFAAQLPTTVSDGLSSSTSLSSLCDYFACCSLPRRFADFLQNFCSAEICTTSLHQQGRDLFVHSLFYMFQTFSRNDLPGEAALARGRYVFQKKGEKTVHF